MYAYSKKTGLQILGTYEMVPARADIMDGSFKLGEDGELEFDYAGESKMFWDGQETQCNDKGRMIFLDRDGNELTVDDIELTEEERE